MNSSSSSSSRPNRFIRVPTRPAIQHPRPPSQRTTTTTGIPSSSSSSSTPVPTPPANPAPPTVGALLTLIAHSLTQTLRLFALADKTHWGPDEFAQAQALRRVLSAAASQFAQLSTLVGGGSYLENDARPDSVAELRALADRFEAHAETFRGWVRTGGPVNPAWVRETEGLGQELRRGLCRAAGRVWCAAREGSEEPALCLGAEVVRRAVRRERERIREERGRERWEVEEGGKGGGGDGVGRGKKRRGSLEAVVPECKAVGRFERLGEEDVAFVCDYCDGFLVWEDLAEVPSERRAEGATVEGGYPNWAAVGRRKRRVVEEDGEEEEKVVVFPPLAIANHVPPRHGEWMSRVTCPYCEEYTYIDAGDDGDGERRWGAEQGGFETVEAFREHLQWAHTALPKPALPLVADKCAVM